MSSSAGMQDVLSRIASISNPPSAVTRIQARFGLSLASAVSSTAVSDATGITTTPAPGVKNTVQTASTNTTISTGAAPSSTATSTATSTAAQPAGGLDGAAASTAPGDWAERLPAAGQPWAAQIAATATKYGIAPEFLGAVVWTESGFNPAAVSPDGAIGLGQLMPATAAWLGVDPYDPAQNLDGAARYYRNLIDRFGSVELATASYFAGPTAVKNAGGIPSERAQDYVSKVLGRRDTLAGL